MRKGKNTKKIKKTKRLKDLIANQMFLDNDEPSRMPLYIFRKTEKSCHDG